jgi:choline dehydrogenase-like flavoprotein
MAIIDLATTSESTTVSADICIVGGGPAGITLAAELAKQGLQVLIIESGHLDREDAFTAGLNNVENIGEDRILDQSKLRNRIFGGSSHSWSGRCTTFDDMDYDRRSWVAASGWPITKHDVSPFIDRAAAYLGVNPATYDTSILDRLRLSADFDATKASAIRSIFWQFSRERAPHHGFVRFGPRFLRNPIPNVSVTINATVTAIETSADGGHVTALSMKTPAGIVHSAVARMFILCAGGIENPRLLLASNAQDPRGIGNRKDLVGRYLMDHPRALIGTFPEGAQSRILPEFGVRSDRSGARFQRGLSLTPETQQREQLLNCAAWIVYDFAPDDIWSALRTARRSGKLMPQVRLALRHADQLVAGAWAKYIRKRALPRRVGPIEFHLTLEQSPDADSRVTLSDRTDAHGVPLATIDWKVSERERRTAIFLGLSVNEALKTSGLPTTTLVDWVRDERPEDAVFFDVAHPTGTTRIGRSDDEGVVDSDCKVFGVDNLYVAGSSVFPTGSHANPTLMILALAIRLADTLVARMDAPQVAAGVETVSA